MQHKETWLWLYLIVWENTTLLLYQLHINTFPWIFIINKQQLFFSSIYFLFSCDYSRAQPSLFETQHISTFSISTWFFTDFISLSVEKKGWNFICKEWEWWNRVSILAIFLFEYSLQIIWLFKDKIWMNLVTISDN